MADEQPKPTKRAFTREFKLEAIVLAEKGEKPIAQLEWYWLQISSSWPSSWFKTLS